MIGGIGPFCSGTLWEQTERYSTGRCLWFVIYLVFRTSFIATKQFRAQKGLETYNQFVCGWVKGVVVHRVDTKFVTTGRARIIALKLRTTVLLSGVSFPKTEWYSKMLDDLTTRRRCVLFPLQLYGRAEWSVHTSCCCPLLLGNNLQNWGRRSLYWEPVCLSNAIFYRSA